MLWYRCNSNIVQFLAELDPGSHMRVRAEDLLADPDEHLVHIAQWLGLRSDSAAVHAMKHPEDSPFACFGPANARMGGDENFLEHPVLRARPGAIRELSAPLPWRTDGAPFIPEIQELAREFGYV
jgi:hypothetical protein